MLDSICSKVLCWRLERSKSRCKSRCKSESSGHFAERAAGRSTNTFSVVSSRVFHFIRGLKCRQHDSLSLSPFCPLLYAMALTWSPAVRWVQRSARQISTSRCFSTSCSIYQQRLADLPDKVSLKTGPLGRLSKVISPRESSKVTTRVGSNFGGNHSLEWCQTPRNILLVKKISDEKASSALKKAVQHIKATYPSMNIIVETDTHAQSTDQLSDVVQFHPDEKHLLSSKVDLTVTLGGDGTILHVSSLFDQDAVPPVLSFSMGTLGFLLPYRESVLSFGGSSSLH
jgi:hypothetical protein